MRSIGIGALQLREDRRRRQEEDRGRPQHIWSGRHRPRRGRQEPEQEEEEAAGGLEQRRVGVRQGRAPGDGIPLLCQKKRQTSK